jgi:hypothetical protein
MLQAQNCEAVAVIPEGLPALASAAFCIPVKSL